MNRDKQTYFANISESNGLPNESIYRSSYMLSTFERRIMSGILFFGYYFRKHSFNYPCFDSKLCIEFYNTAYLKRLIKKQQQKIVILDPRILPFTSLKIDNAETSYEVNMRQKTMKTKGRKLWHFATKLDKDHQSKL